MPTLKQKLLSGVACLALFETSSAIAASPMQWGGFYIGGHVGYSWGSVDGDTEHSVIAGYPPFYVPPGTVIFPSVQRDLDPNGGLGGVQAGYNFQSGQIVYGIVADLSWTGQRDSFNFSGRKTVQSEDFNYQETATAKLRYMGTVRGRLGYASGDFLPYLTGGFAWGRLALDLNWRLTQDFCSLCVTSFADSEAHTLVGWTLGAGFEYALTEHWSAKVEYLYVDLGKETYFAGVQGGGSFGMQDHTVRFGINFRP